MSAASELKATLRRDLRTAMAARDTTATRVLRQTLSAIENAEAVPHDDRPPTVGQSGDVARRDLTAADLLAVIAREHAERASAIAEYRELGVTATIEALEGEAAVLQPYLELVGEQERGPTA
jgi:uncharacterized protein